MVKGISAINNVVKKGVMGAIMASSVLLGASSPIKNTKQETQPTQTELMSKESAEALKANSLQQTQQSVPTVHNPKLDAMYLKFAESQDDINFVNNKCNNMYSNLGTYLGSIIIQKEIDSQMLIALLKKNTNLIIKNNINPKLGRKIEGFGEPFYATITPNAETIKKWLFSYNSIINSNLQFDHKPTAKEVSDRLDFIAENKMNFTQDEIIEYHVYSNDFLYSQLKDKKGIQAASDLLAYKIYMIDRLAFAKELYGVGVFGRGSFDDNKGHDMRYFYEQWMESVAPKAN